MKKLQNSKMLQFLIKSISLPLLFIIYFLFLSSTTVSAAEPEYGYILRLTATSGEYSDETVIRFKQDATTEFDSELDAYKLFNQGLSPSFFSVSPTVNYSINSLPSNLIEKTVPLTLIVAFDGRYSLTADLSEFEDRQSVFIEDRLLGITQDLRENKIYSVTLERGNVEERFFVHYKNQSLATVTATTGQSLNSDIEIASSPQTVSVFFSAPTDKVNITLVDQLGQIIYTAENLVSDSGKINISLPSLNPDIYIVMVQTTSRFKSQQVFIPK